MILVVAEAVLKEGVERQFLAAARECIAATRKEAGNISYVLLKNFDLPGQFTFLEEWESKDSLEDHVNSAHFNAFSRSIQNLLSGKLQIKVYQAEQLNL